jgi:hypothetical protein
MAASSADAAVPAALLRATCRAACQISSGTSIAHVVSSSITRLAEGVLSTMTLHKWKPIALGLMVSGVFLTGAAVVARQQATKSNKDLPAGERAESEKPSTPLELRGPANVGSAPTKAGLAQDELLLAQGSGGRQAPRPRPAVEGASNEPGKDKKSQEILARLEEPVAMAFANETPLDDVLKYIQQATTAPNRPGIPIYVDPLGLQEADKTLTSTITINLEGVPLRRTLQLALKQLGLGYFVDDGILVITSVESGEQGGLSPSQIGPAPTVRKQNQLELGEMPLEEMKAYAEELKVTTEIMRHRCELKQLQRRYDDLNNGRQAGTESGSGAAVNAEQATALLKEIRSLVELLKADREKTKKDGAK